MEAAALRVVIAEDSALIREGIARLVEESGGTVVAKVGDGTAFVEAVEQHRPDVSVVDVRMPPSQRDEGLRAAIEARRRNPATRHVRGVGPAPGREDRVPARRPADEAEGTRGTTFRGASGSGLSGMPTLRP